MPNKKSTYRMQSADAGGPMRKNFPSVFKNKPTKKELMDAANDPNNPNSLKNLGEAGYYAWKAGGVVPKEKKQSNTTIGTCGTIENTDGEINRDRTARQLGITQAELNKRLKMKS
jgi:hypothetical protein